MVSDHIIDQLDDSQCDALIGQCGIIGQRVMVMVDDGQRDDHIGQCWWSM